MTRIKLCGLSRPQDVEAANRLCPQYIGFVFAPKSKRYVSPQRARELKRLLTPGIQAVGVFVNEAPEHIAQLLAKGIIDAAQLHGGESPEYVASLRQLTQAPLFQAFSIAGPEDIQAAQESKADWVLLDSGPGGTGSAFDWALLEEIRRPYFLAGGLTPQNVAQAVASLHPYGVDVSSGIETLEKKDSEKMTAFVHAVRSIER